MSRYLRLTMMRDLAAGLLIALFFVLTLGGAIATYVGLVSAFLWLGTVWAVTAFLHAVRLYVEHQSRALGRR
jgi:hypothetical protein